MDAYALNSSTVMVSADGGRSWQRSEAGLPTEVVRGQGRTATTKVTAATGLFFVGNKETPYLLLQTNKGLFRSEDKGTSWKPASNGLPATGVFDTASVGADDIVLGSTDGLYRSTDGKSWSSIAVSTIKLKPGYYKGISRLRGKSGLLVLFSYTTDTYDNFEALRLGYVGKDLALVGLNYGVLPGSTILDSWMTPSQGKMILFSIVLAIKGYGSWPELYMSADEGYSWGLVAPPMTTDPATHIAIRRTNPSDIFLFGPGIYKGSAEGTVWTQPAGFITSGPVGTIAFDPGNTRLLYYTSGITGNDDDLYRYQYDAVSGQGQAVKLNAKGTKILLAEDNSKLMFTNAGYLSTDGGWTWINKSAGILQLQQASNKMISFLSFRDGEIRCVREIRNGGVEVLRSTDLSNSWQRVGLVKSAALIDAFANPNESRNLFLATQAPVNGPPYNVAVVQLHETTDGGATWSPIFEHKLEPGDGVYRSITSVASLATPTGRIILISGRGLWRSDDNAKTWRQLGGIQ